MERLAILGGTFDPIHAGHLRMAHAIQKQLEFDSIVFLPAFKPPHKQVRHDFAPFEDRLAMVSLAIQPYEAFTVSSLEAERGGLSYTFDTVCCLQELWPDADIYMIIGEDSLDQLYTWHRILELLRLVHFVVAERPGYEGEDGVARLVAFCGAWAKEKIIHAEVPETALSSTEIRQRIKEGLPVRGMIPREVERYMADHALYK